MLATKGVAWNANDRRELDNAVAVAGALGDPAGFYAACAEDSTLSLDEAIAQALKETLRDARRPPNRHGDFPPHRHRWQHRTTRPETQPRVIHTAHACHEAVLWATLAAHSGGR